MKQTVTIEIADNSVMQLLRNLAEMSLVRFTSETPSGDELIIAQINEVCKEVDTSNDLFNRSDLRTTVCASITL
jgi:hypothetical protein